MIDFIKSEKFILPIVYIVIGSIIYTVIRLLLGRVSRSKRVNKKKNTIISLVRNIIKYLILILTVLAILSVYGVDTKGIITSIGVAGVIVGLAFQDMVADFLAGILIIFDNHYAIGDIVKIDDFMGTVDSFGLMTTKIKAATGEVLILHNSSFKKIVNYNMFNTVHYINVDVAYDTDIKKLEKVLASMEDDVKNIDGYVGNYKLLGIAEFASSSIRYMVSLECENVKRMQVRRDFNNLIKEYFDKNKIEIPYTKVDVNIRRNNG